jgi:hypothetical protein
MCCLKGYTKKLPKTDTVELWTSMNEDTRFDCIEYFRCHLKSTDKPGDG